MVMELNTYLRRIPGEGLRQGVGVVREGVGHASGFQGPTNEPRPPSHPIPGSVLYISLHRYDHGTFFPMGDEGACSQMGRAAGTGFTVNVAWNGPHMGDTDYLSAWHRLVLPIAYEVRFRRYVTLFVGGSGCAYD